MGIGFSVSLFIILDKIEPITKKEKNTCSTQIFINQYCAVQHRKQEL